MDGPIDAGAAGQSGIGGIHNRIGFFLRNIPLNQRKQSVINLYFHDDSSPLNGHGHDRIFLNAHLVQQ